MGISEIVVVVLVILVLSAWLYVTFRYSILVPKTDGLPILRYHKVSNVYYDDLTITTNDLNKQFEYLKEKGFNIISLSDFLKYLNKETKLPPNPVMLTFDDGYQNNYELLYPLLQKYNFKASIFIPIGLLGKRNEWDEGKEKIMDEITLLKMNNNLVEYGFQSFNHRNYKSLSLQEIELDLQNSFSSIKKTNLYFQPVLAYSYGGYPREKGEKKIFKNVLKKNGIKVGMRIGNRVNKFPLKDFYEVKRIDIKGTDTFWEFTTKLRKGRVKMF